MKIRQGFVSNSSSSSFIINSQKDEEEFARVFRNIEIYKVSDLLNKIEKIEESFKKIYAENKDAFKILGSLDFSTGFYTIFPKYEVQELKKLIEKHGPDVKITRPEDRDDAYMGNLSLPVFKGDL